jgi:hypothetical protein
MFSCCIISCFQRYGHSNIQWMLLNSKWASVPFVIWLTWCTIGLENDNDIEYLTVQLRIGVAIVHHSLWCESKGNHRVDDLLDCAFWIDAAPSWCLCIQLIKESVYLLFSLSCDWERKNWLRFICCSPWMSKGYVWSDLLRKTLLCQPRHSLSIFSHGTEQQNIVDFDSVIVVVVFGCRIMNVNGRKFRCGSNPSESLR